MSYGLPTNFQSAPRTWDAPDIDRINGLVNTQLEGAVLSQGQGIRVARFGDTSFAVTAGTGLQVLVAPGTGTILGTGVVPNANIRRDTQLALTVPTSSTCYIWQGIEQRTTPSRNFTEETGLPLTFQSSNATEPNAIPLATVTTSGSAVTGIIDTRGAPIDAPKALNQTTKTAAYTVVGGEDRIDLDASPGATITLPVASAALWKKPRITIANIGTEGTWTVALSGSDTFPDGSTSISLPPGNALETYVAQRAGGASYRWAKI